MNTMIGKWGFSRDGESYHGQYDTREEACQEAEACDYGRYYVGMFDAPILEQAFDADDILEKILCQDDYCGDWGEDAFDCTQEQRDELTADLRRVFLLWCGKHGMEPSFGLVREPEEIIVDGAITK